MTAATIYTVLCDEFGCLWQGSTHDEEEAKRWGLEHVHGRYGTTIYEEEDEDDE